MELNEKFLESIAKIARLSLTAEEKKNFLKELKEILDSFSKLDEVNTTNIEPSFQPLPISPLLREDVPKKSLTQEEVLSLTKHKKDGYFKGPRILA